MSQECECVRVKRNFGKGLMMKFKLRDNGSVDPLSKFQIGKYYRYNISSGNDRELVFLFTENESLITVCSPHIEKIGRRSINQDYPNKFELFDGILTIDCT